VCAILEKDKGHDDKQDHQDGDGIFEHISKETGHFDAGFFRNGFDHEIRRISDIGIGAHKNRANGNGGQIRNFLNNQQRDCRRFGHSRVEFAQHTVEKSQVRGGIIQKTGKDSNRPEILGRGIDCFDQPVQGAFFAGF